MYINNIQFKNICFSAVLLLLSCIASVNTYGQGGGESTFQKANKLFKQERWEEAKQVVDMGLKESPYDADLLMLNGKYYHYKKN